MLLKVKCNNIFNFFKGCDELELGLARVQDLSTEQIRSMDPMNVAYTRYV